MHASTSPLIKMANQIGTYFEAQHVGDIAAAAKSVTAHLKAFWAPAMRADLVGQVDRGEADALMPVVAAAVRNHRNVLLLTNAHLRQEDDEVFPAGGGDAG